MTTDPPQESPADQPRWQPYQGAPEAGRRPEPDEPEKLPDTPVVIHVSHTTVESPTPTRARTGGIPVVIALLVVGVIGVVSFVLVKSVGDDIADAVSPPQLHTKDGWTELTDAVRNETGGTEVFRAVIYPDYASLDLPAEATGKRQITYYFRGELEEGSKGSSSYGRVDLADVDLDALFALLEEAKTLIEDPDTWYLIVEGEFTTFDDPPSMSAYVSNEFSEGGYIEATLDGEELGRHTW